MSDSGENTRDFTTIAVDELSINETGCAGPERGLFSALLFDGIQSYLSYTLSSSDLIREKYAEAHRWVHTPDPEYVFSFDNVCEAVGIDPNALRLGLSNFIHSNQMEEGLTREEEPAILRQRFRKSGC